MYKEDVCKIPDYMPSTNYFAQTKYQRGNNDVRVFLGEKLIGDCGCMVALNPGKEVQGKVVGASKGAGFEYLMTRIGVGTY